MNTQTSCERSTWIPSNVFFNTARYYSVEIKRAGRFCLTPTVFTKTSGTRPVRRVYKRNVSDPVSRWQKQQQQQQRRRQQHE